MMITEDMVSRLPEELLVEVLLRLPVKLLLQLRCVSKLFRNLITSHGSFARSYLQNLSNNHDITIRNNFVFSNELMLVDQEFGNFGKPITNILAGILGDSGTYRFIFPDDCYHSFGGCYDGILCFCDRRNIPRIYLCNPALNQSRLLPKIPGYSADYRGYSTPKVCFIPDPQTNSYKVLVIQCEKSPFEIFIYSLRHDCWKQIKRPVGDWKRQYMDSNDRPMLIHNGNPHLISERKHEGEEVEEVVHVLDVTEEIIRQIKLPEDRKRPPHFSTYLNLERYKGCLAVTYDSLLILGLHDFWVMDDDSKCWVKQVIRIGLPSPLRDKNNRPRSRLCKAPLANTSWTDIIHKFYSDGSAAFLTDMEDENSAQKCKGGKDLLLCSYIVAEYVNSFVSVLPPPTEPDHKETS